MYVDIVISNVFNLNNFFPVSTENASSNFKLKRSRRIVYIWFENQTLGFQNGDVASALSSDLIDHDRQTLE